MARYIRVFPAADAQCRGKIREYLNTAGFREKTRDGGQVFQKGDGVWAAARFVKLTWQGNYVRLEAWVDTMGAEQDLEGYVAVAVKKPLKKVVAHIEAMLTEAAGESDPEPAAEAMPAYCPRCGAAWPDGRGYCARCGHIAGEPIVTPEVAAGMPAGTYVSKREYLKKYAGDGFKQNLRVCAIIGYVLCGIQLLTVLANPYVLIDLAICLGLTLGMHLGRSKGCAIGILVYFGFSAVVGLLTSGTLGGWAWLIVGLYALSGFNTAEKRYKELTNT